MDYLEILRSDVLIYLSNESKEQDIEGLHEEIHDFVFTRMEEFRQSILKEYKDKIEFPAQKDRTALLNDFLDGFESAEWKKYFNPNIKSRAGLRELKASCLVKSSVTENLFYGNDIASKSKDFYSIYLDYPGWNNFRQQKSKDKHHKNNPTRLLSIPKYLTDYIPQIDSNKIVGRESDLKDMRQRLFDQKPILVVKAMGGIGKTTLAGAYVERHLKDYKHIAWVNQGFGNSFKIDLIGSIGLLERLGISQSDDLSTDQRYSMVLSALEGMEVSPCLMVIDNADETLADFRNRLPKYPQWHILITSRETIPFFDEVKELDFLSLDEAVRLFKINYGRKDLDKTAIEDIVRELDFHTLTIEIFAKTVKKRDRTPESILDFLEQNKKADLRVRHNIDDGSKKAERITDYLCEIFKISNLTEDNKWLLQRLSCLPPISHNYTNILRELVHSHKEQFDLRENLEDLHEKGWLLYEKKIDNYKLHRIIIKVIHRSLRPSIETIEVLIDKVIQKFPLDWKKGKLTDKYNWISSGKAILNRFSRSNNHYYKLQYRLSLIIHQALGGTQNLSQTRQWFKCIQDLSLWNLKEDDLRAASNYSGVAAVIRQDFGSKNDLLRAKMLLEKTIDIYKEKFDEKDSHLISGYFNLALVLRDLGGRDNLLEAKILLKKAIDMSREEDFFVATCYLDLATVLEGLGGKEDLLQAKKCWGKAYLINKNFR